LHRFFFSICTHIGTDHPALKHLNIHVIPDIADKWYDIGVELLDAKDEIVLNNIKADFVENHDKCASEMFQLWLARKSDASWNQLIKAFRQPSIGLNALASNIEAMLSKGTYDCIL